MFTVIASDLVDTFVLDSIYYVRLTSAINPITVPKFNYNGARNNFRVASKQISKEL